MQIHYCSECHVRVSSTDLESGSGISFEGNIYCDTCAKELNLYKKSRAPHKQDSHKAGKNRIASGWKRTHPHVNRAAFSRRHRLYTTAIVTVVICIILLLGLITVILIIEPDPPPSRDTSIDSEKDTSQDRTETEPEDKETEQEYDDRAAKRKTLIKEYTRFLHELNTSVQPVEEYLKKDNAAKEKLDAYFLSIAEKRKKLDSYREAGFDVDDHLSRLDGLSDAIMKKIDELALKTKTAESEPEKEPGKNPEDMPAPVMSEGYVPVESGTFRMGSENGPDNGKPVHDVTVSTLCIAKYEVTVAEFREFVKSTGYTTSAEKFGGAWIYLTKNLTVKKDASWRNPYLTQGDTHPVVCVSWFDAVEYCNWLSTKEGFEQCYTIQKNNITCDFTKNGYRLPTEAEWEYAARGGGRSKGFTYSGSNDRTESGWYDRTSGGKTHPVGEKKPNELGIYDMSGNVYEWCWDRYDRAYYAKSPKDNPTGPSSGNKRIVRGGSWHSDRGYMESVRRNGRISSGSYNYLGFRPVRTVGL